jgi:hypothetical protein
LTVLSTRLGSCPPWAADILGDGGWISPIAGALIEGCRSANFISRGGISFNNELKEPIPLTVDMDEILEWHPDCDDDVYDERLLWLSENLCFGAWGKPPAICSSSSRRKFGLETSQPSITTNE